LAGSLASKPAIRRGRGLRRAAFLLGLLATVERGLGRLDAVLGGRPTAITNISVLFIVRLLSKVPTS
jgi:hypothetical protein